MSFDRPPVVDMPRNIVDVVRHYVRDLDARLAEGRGLTIVGDVGTGKTTLAMLVSKEALARGRSVAIYSVPRLLAEIRRTYDDGAERSYVDLLDRLAAVDLLHLDDLGAERTSEWVLEQLYSIINARYEEGRSILVTTNVKDRDELREQIGERTVSRLVEMTHEELPLHGQDRRLEFRPS